MNARAHVALALLLASQFLSRQALAAGTCTYDQGVGNALTCDDACNVVGVCQIGNLWIPSRNCQASGLVCRNGACVPMYDTFCRTAPSVNCPEGQTGVFPSLTDCTTYYECSGGTDIATPNQCAGSCFDACTGRCTGRLVNGLCPTEGFVPCVGGNQMGVAPGNDALYYICEPSRDPAFPGTVVPGWYTCPAGYRFSVSQRTCVDVGWTSSCTVCGNAKPVPGPLPHGSSSCRYIWCHSRDNFDVVECRDGWHYEHSQRVCVYGACR